MPIIDHTIEATPALHSFAQSTYYKGESHHYKNDTKPLVLYLAIKLSSWDKDTSSHNLYAPGFKG